MTDLTKQLEEALMPATNPKCPNCAGKYLAVERRMDGGAVCQTCGWQGYYDECFRVKQSDLAPLHAALLKCVEALGFYGDKNNWNRDLDGWRHDIVEKDLDDETLNRWDGRFSGRRAREALADLRKALEECK